MKINEKITQRRLELNLTLEQVAIAVGVAKSTVQKWESGQIASMRQSKLLSLAKALRVSPEYLLYDDAEKEARYLEVKAAGELENELVSVFRKMTVQEKIKLINYAYDITNKGGRK